LIARLQAERRAPGQLPGCPGLWLSSPPQLLPVVAWAAVSQVRLALPYISQVVGAVGFGNRCLAPPAMGDAFLIDLCNHCMALEQTVRPTFSQVSAACLAPLLAHRLGVGGWVGGWGGVLTHC
jgi:hypothetical protein